MVDLATYRARIGCHNARAGRLSCQGANMDLAPGILTTLLAASLIGLLLLIGGVETNPGPNTTKMEVADSSKDLDLTQADKQIQDLKMASSPTVLRYTRMPGIATTKGQDYEITMAALLFVRGLNSKKDFQLATHVLGAGAMDDIVLRFKSQQEGAAWTTIFVQLKHKDNSWVNRSMLKSHGGDFSLAKYFQSFLEIKQAMTSTGRRDVLFDGDFKDSQFVIFTNAKEDAHLVGGRSENFSQDEKFLWSGSGRVFSLESDEEMLKCLGEQGGEFLSRLRLFCNQPNVKKLQAAVREEIASLGKEEIGDLNIERLCDCYLANVKVWWESRNEILHKGHNILDAALRKVRLETCSEQTLKDYKLELDFEDGAISDFKLQLVQLESPMFHIVSSDSSCKLTLTKLVQSPEGQLFVLPAQQLSVHQQALLAERKNEGKKKQLIVVAKDWRSEQLDVIVDLLERMRDTFSIVILSDGNNDIDSQLSERFQGMFASYKDYFYMSQLKLEPKYKLLYKVVNSQGQEMTLSTFLNKNNEYLDPELTASLTVNILKSNGMLTIGSALPKGISFYVPRTLESGVLQDLEGSVTMRLIQNKPSDEDLFGKAFDFVNSLTDYSSFHHGYKQDIINKLLKSPLVPDRKNSEILIGRKYPLGFYEFNCVAFQLDQNKKVTALCVCTTEEASKKYSLLFVSNKTKEEDITKFSEFHVSEKLLWLKENQVFLRFSPETAVDVEDRLVLVSAEPGMGKSTLMARLAKNTKAALPHYFVILIALNDHSELFAEGKHKDALEFLSLAAKMDSPLQRSLLKFALEVSGNVVVILDGFDEIAPRYAKQSCDLLSSILKETKVSKIWMTSRNSVKEILEIRFSKISIKLCEFDKEEQKQFLKKFWAGKSSEEKLNEFIDHILEKSASDIGDKDRNFFGIPLQTRMLAEVYESHLTGSAEKIELPNEVDLLSLMKKFIDMKYNIYFQDKLKIAANNPNAENLFTMSRNDFFASHTKAALILIHGDDNNKSLEMDQLISESSTFFNDIKRGAYMTGFIDEIINDKPRFIHPAIAEYLAANWLSQNFVGHIELVRSKMFTPDFNVIRYFFNGILCKGCVLHTAVLQENVEQVKTLLESEDVEVQDAGGRTALHLAASLGASEDQEENTRRCEILDLIIDKTRDFKVVDKVLCGSPLRYADITRWWTAIDKLLCKTDDNGQLILTLENVKDEDMLDTIIEQDLDKLLGFCLDNGLEVEYRYKNRDGDVKRLLVKACSDGCVKVASLLIERNADIKKIITSRNQDESDEDQDDLDGPLIEASSNGHLEIVKLLVEKYVSTLASPSQCEVLDGETKHPDISKYINMKDWLGRTAIHWAARNGHTDVITYLLSQDGDPLSRDILFHRTPLHWAAECNKSDALRVLLEALSETQRVDVIHSLDHEGDNVLHHAARRGSVEWLQLLFDAGGKLCLVNCKGETTLMIVARTGNREAVKWLLENLDEEREGITLVDFINMEDKDGNTARNHAAREGSVECFQLLFDAGMKWCQVNCEGETTLMIAARRGKQEAVKWLVENLDEEREGITLVDFINKKDKDGKAAWDTTNTECSRVIKAFNNSDFNLRVESKDTNDMVVEDSLPVTQVGEEIDANLSLEQSVQNPGAEISSCSLQEQTMPLSTHSEVKVTELGGYGIEFQPYYLQRLAGAVPSSGILSVLVKYRTTITAVRVWKALTTIAPDSSRKLLFLDLATLCSDASLWEDWLLGDSWDVSVVECNGICLEGDVSRLGDNILKMISKAGNTKLLLLVGRRDHKLVARLQNIGYCASYTDSCKWCQLSEKTQEKFLSSEIYLQGEALKFEEAFEHSLEMVDEEVLSQLLKKETQCGRRLEEVTVRSFRDRQLITKDNEDVKSLDLLSDEAGRVVLLVADPGWGKSTLITHLATQAKKDDPRAWIVHIKLHEWTTLLAKVDSNIITAWEFLKSCALTEENELVNILFESRNMKMLIFVDGFDELNQNEVGQAVKLLASFKDFKIRKLIISSPLYCASELESTLGSKRYDLCKFSVTEQLNYFSLKDNFAVPRDLSRHRFWGVPFISAIVAKEFEGRLATADDILEVYKSLDLYELLDAIVTKYVGDSTVFKNLEYVSLCQMFGSDEITAWYLAGKYEPPVRQEGSVDVNLEFLTLDSTGHSSFVHRLFAEYFTARWLNENWKENAELVERILTDPFFNGVKKMVSSIVPKKDIDDISEEAVVNESTNKLDDTLDRIFAAAKDGNVTQLKALAAKGVSLKDVKDNEGSTLLHHVAQFGHMKAVRFLTEQDVDDQVKNNNKKTALELAVEAGRLNVVRYFLYQRETDKAGNSSIHLAARNGDITTLKYLLLQRGAIVDIVNDLWQTASHLAEERNQCTTLRFLLETGAKLTADKSGSLPLHIAARVGHVEAVKTLLSVNPNLIDSVDLLGQTALFVAVRENHLGVVELLLNAGAGLKEDDKGDSLLHCAVSEGNLKVTKYLLEVKLFDVNAKDALGRTVLDCAICNGQEDVKVVLLKAGGKPSDESTF